MFEVSVVTVNGFVSQREKDLELAAKIGQTLLHRNKLLEADLMAALDQRQQGEQQVSCSLSLFLSLHLPSVL